LLDGPAVHAEANALSGCSVEGVDCSNTEHKQKIEEKGMFLAYGFDNFTIMLIINLLLSAAKWKDCNSDVASYLLLLLGAPAGGVIPSFLRSFIRNMY